MLLLGAALSVASLGAEPEPTPPVLAPEYDARLLGTETRESLAALRGRAVLINTWATWCGPCLQELPAFEAEYRRHRAAGLVVIGVNIDEGPADGKVQALVRGMKLSFPVWRDPNNRFARRFQVRGVPETLLIDRDGRVARRWSGPMEPDEPDNRRSIEAVLAAKRAAS